MEIERWKVEEAEEKLFELLGPELSEVTIAISQAPGSANKYLIEIPDTQTVDLSLAELASLVARSSNAYGRIARFAGVARAHAKLAKGRYERKFKRSRVGRNEAERDSAAMTACETEHIALVTAEAIAEMSDAMESAARVASESSRKIMDKVAAMDMASRREEKGAYRDSDFRSY